MSGGNKKVKIGLGMMSTNYRKKSKIKIRSEKSANRKWYIKTKTQECLETTKRDQHTVISPKHNKILKHQLLIIIKTILLNFLC